MSYYLPMDNSDSQLSEALFDSFIVPDPNAALIESAEYVQQIPEQIPEYCISKNEINENQTRVSRSYNRYSPYDSSSSRSSSVSSVHSHVKFGTYNPMNWTSQRVYFIPAKAEGPNQTHAKGKLVERWKNVSRRLRSVGAIDLNRKKSDSLRNTESNITFSDDIQEAKEWLKNEGCSALFEDIKVKWILTHEIRKTEFPDLKLRNLNDLFESWIVLKSPRGHELISEDFFLDYPSQKTLFPDWKAYLTKWTKVSNILINVRRSSIKDKHAKGLLSKLDSVHIYEDNNTADVIKILLIPYLTPTKTIIKKCDVSGVKKNWKPSLEESARSFVTVVPNISEIESDIIQRRNKYCQFGCTIQPFVYLVGEDLSSISQSYVRVDNQLWTFNSPLEALDACFKAYFGLNCSYPRECYESWIFIQQHIYGLKTEYDQLSAITTSISNKFDMLNTQ
ncbi:uncharacterized protein LOC114119410 [Aphis gossypii]|uniref:uncharacterized protein LOC114119410 n=1 Tax=Aphis gossypii TaxID=80765 RepID=UPI00215966AD|nr:uncharacterized protein LOC114119410 [Aphis gossypii]